MLREQLSSLAREVRSVQSDFDGRQTSAQAVLAEAMEQSRDSAMEALNCASSLAVKVQDLEGQLRREELRRGEASVHAQRLEERVDDVGAELRRLSQAEVSHEADVEAPPQRLEKSCGQSATSGTSSSSCDATCS